MRLFSQNVLALLSRDEIAAIYMVEMNIKGTILRHSNTPYDVTVQGIGTFQSENKLMVIEAPKLSKVVDRESYKIVYADPDFEFKEMFDYGAVGSKLTVYVTFINMTDYEIGGAQPGEPLLEASDVIKAYQGIIDSHGYNVTEDGEVTVTLEASSPMADLDLKKVFYTTKEDIKRFNPNDTAFDQVYEGSSQIDLVWGKA